MPSIITLDEPRTVTMFRLGANQTYETAEQIPPADLLEHSPMNYLS